MRLQKKLILCSLFLLFTSCRSTGNNGFSHQCRLNATRFPVGINSAMYTTMCVIDKCYGMSVEWEKLNSEAKGINK